MTCIGNICAFLTGNVLTSVFKCRWEVTMLIFAILNLVAAMCLYFFIEEDGYDDKSRGF